MDGVYILPKYGYNYTSTVLSKDPLSENETYISHFTFHALTKRLPQNIRYFIISYVSSTPTL